MDGMPFFGYHMPSFTFPGLPQQDLFDHVASLARAAESAGFELVTVMDHFYQITGIGGGRGAHDGGLYDTGCTGPCNQQGASGHPGHRSHLPQPGARAKMVTTLDVISKGPAVCGIGAAWNESEHIGYGFDFPPVRERMDRLEEALTIFKLMFSQERPSFTGTYYRIERALNNPRPLQPGGPKILVGGGGESARFAWWPATPICPTGSGR